MSMKTHPGRTLLAALLFLGPSLLAGELEQDFRQPPLDASSQHQHYGPALAEDGNDASRWISNGDRPGQGPTATRPEFLQFNFNQPCAAAGVYRKPYADCGPRDIEVQASDDGRSFRPLQPQTLSPSFRGRGEPGRKPGCWAAAKDGPG